MADESLAALAVRFGADTSAAEQSLRQFSHFFQGIMKEMTEGARGRYKKNVVVDEAAAQVERIKQVQTEMLGAQAELEAKFLQQPFSRSDFMKMETMRNSGYSRDADAYEKSLYRKQDAESAHAKAMSAVQAGQLDAARAFYKVYLDLTESEEQKRERLILEAAARFRKQLVAENEATLAAANKTLLETQITDFAKRLMDMTRGYKGVLEGMPMTSRFSPTLEEGGRLGVKGPEMDALQELHRMDLQLQTIRAAERRANLNGEYDLAVELHKMAGDMEASINRSVHDKNMDNIDAEARANIQAARDGAEATKAQDAATAAARVRTAQEAERKMAMDSRLVRAERLRETLRDPTDLSKGTFAREAQQLENAVQFEQMLRTRFADQSKILRDQQAAAAEVASRALKSRDKDLYAAAIQAHTYFTEQLKGNSAKIATASGTAQFAIMNLAYGVQDAATVWGTSGFAGAVRASANNVASLGVLFGSAGIGAGGLAAALATPAVALIGLSTAVMLGADAWEKYKKSEEDAYQTTLKLFTREKEFYEKRIALAADRAQFEQRVVEVAGGGREAAVDAVRQQQVLVDVKEAELNKAKELAKEEEKRVKTLDAQIARLMAQKALEERTRGPDARDKLAAFLEGKDQPEVRERIDFDEKIRQLEIQRRAAINNRAEAARAERDVQKELDGEIERLDRLIEASEEARVDADKRAALEREMAEFEKDKADKVRFSDIAILQAERQVANLQTQLKSVYDVPMAGMAQAGSQEAANIRARSMRREADAEKKELQEQLKVSREQLDELKAIREQMQPGYLVESFKP